MVLITITRQVCNMDKEQMRYELVKEFVAAAIGGNSERFVGLTDHQVIDVCNDMATSVMHALDAPQDV